MTVLPNNRFFVRLFEFTGFLFGFSDIFWWDLKHNLLNQLWRGDFFGMRIIRDLFIGSVGTSTFILKGNLFFMLCSNDEILVPDKLVNLLGWEDKLVKLIDPAWNIENSMDVLRQSRILFQPHDQSEAILLSDPILSVLLLSIDSSLLSNNCLAKEIESVSLDFLLLRDRIMLGELGLGDSSFDYSAHSDLSQWLSWQRYFKALI